MAAERRTGLRPAFSNSLMKHLRDSGIDINGSAQKRRLKNIGYYHGYKGYRFAGNAANRLSTYGLLAGSRPLRLRYAT